MLKKICFKNQNKGLITNNSSQNLKTKNPKHLLTIHDLSIYKGGKLPKLFTELKVSVYKKRTV